MVKPSIGSLSVIDTWVNGEPQSTTSLHDRGLQYGDGFFTTLLITQKKILNWPAHWRRIEHSCKALNFPVPDSEQLKSWIAQALLSYLNEKQERNCVLKILFTRGEGGIGYQAPSKVKLNCLFVMKPSPIVSIEIENQPMEAGLCNHLASISGLAGIKSLNRLENVLARSEIVTNGFSEGIMINHNKQIACGTQSNVFIIKDKRVITPKLDLSGVEGTTRYQLMSLLPDLGFQVEEAELTLEQLHQADEVFFTNAVRGIQPVNKFLNTTFCCEQTKLIHQAWLSWQLKNAINIQEFV